MEAKATTMIGTNKSEKRVLEEWTSTSTKFSNTLRSFEERTQKQIKVTCEGEENPSIVVSENGDGPIENQWHFLLTSNKEELSRAVDTMRVLQKERTQYRRGSFGGSMKGALLMFGKKQEKKQQRQKFSLEDFVDQMEDHKNLMEDVINGKTAAEDILKQGKEISAQDNTEKVMSEVNNLSARWSALNVDVLKKGMRFKLLATKVDEAHKHFRTWQGECRTMDEWLKEKERATKQVKGKRHDTIKWKALQTDNEALRVEAQSYKPQALAVIAKSEELLDKNLLDHADVETVEKTRSSLWSRWQRLNSHLLQRNDRLSSLILKGDTMDGAGTSEQESGTVTTEETQFLDTVGKMMKDLKHSSDEAREMLQDEGFKLFNTEIDGREKANLDYDNKSMHSFSAAGSSVSEVFQQIGEIQAFEEGLNAEEARAICLNNKLEEARSESLVREPHGATLSKRVEELQSKWTEQRRQHMINKNRLLQAMLTHCGQWVIEENAKLDSLEDQIEFMEIAEDASLTILQEQYQKHEEITAELNNVDEKANVIIKDIKSFLSQELIDEGTSTAVHDELRAIEERMQTLRQKSQDNTTRFHSLINGKSENDKDKLDTVSLMSETSSVASFDLRMDYMLPSARESISNLELKTERKRRSPGDKGFLDSINAHLEYKKPRAKEELTKVEEDLAKHFATSLSECENAMLELEEESTTTFAEVGTTITEVLQHTVDMQSFEDDMKLEEGRFTKVKNKFDESNRTGLLGKEQVPALNERCKELNARWNRQWQLHGDNKTKLVHVMSTYSGDWLKQINKKLDSLEEMVDFIEVRKDDPGFLQEEQQRQKELSGEIDNLDPTARMVTQFSRDPLLTNMANRDTVDLIGREAKAINAKMKSLHLKAKKNERRLLKALSRRNQHVKTAGKGQHGLNSDEGFVELDDENFALKDEKFHSEVGSLTEWMDETVKLVQSLHVDMDPKEASRVQESIETKSQEARKKELKIDELNKVGGELQRKTADVVEREIIADKVAGMNLQWSETKAMLDSTAEYGGRQESSVDNDCCLGRILRRKFTSLRYL